jgi:hypothetical protein
MDRQLRVLIERAEQGHVCPPVKLLTAAAWISGQPRSSSAFADAMRPAVESEMWHPYSRDKKHGEAAYLAQMQAIKPTWDAATSIVAAPSDEPVLTLTDVSLWPPAAKDGLAVPALRVPSSAITGWWYAGAKRLPAGGNWFFGVAISVPIGK